MPKLKKLSGHELIKILCNKFEFATKRQKGSHVILIKDDEKGRVGCTVPLHKELKIGTLKGILEQACISEDEFTVPADSRRGLGNFIPEELQTYTEQAFRRFYLRPLFILSRIYRAFLRKDYGLVKRGLHYIINS